MTGAVANKFSLEGRRAIVTGGAGHLGRVFGETLVELGAHVVLVDRDAESLAVAAASVAVAGRGSVESYRCDLESGDERRALAAALGGAAEGVSVLVHNAAFVGTNDLRGWAVPFESQSLETWRRAIEVNLTAVFDVTQALLPELRRAPGPSVINVASIYGALGPDWSLYEGTTMANPAAYATSKGGLLQLTRWLATTLAPSVRVNAIVPGGIIRGQQEKFVKRYKSRTPLQRMATEDDFQGVLAFLSSDASAYVTGQAIAIDGGWSAW